jgi:hypothetical protein
MNGLRCYLSRDEAKTILAAAVNERLNVVNILGQCRCDIQVLEDSRVEVAFWGPEEANESEKDSKTASTAPAKK